MCTARRDIQDHSQDQATASHSEPYFVNIPVVHSLSHQSFTREQQADCFPSQCDVGPPLLSSKAGLAGCGESFPAHASKSQANCVGPESYPHSWICLGHGLPFSDAATSAPSSPSMEQFYFFSEPPLQPSVPSQASNIPRWRPYQTLVDIPGEESRLFPSDLPGHFGSATGLWTEELLNPFNASDTFSIPSERRRPPSASCPPTFPPVECLRSFSSPVTSPTATPSSSSTPQSAPTTRSPQPTDLSNFGTLSADGHWRCAYPGCSSQVIFRRGCDLRKHFNRHRKHFFCRHEGCPQASHGGFSSRKDRARHEAKHNPGIPCEWPECGRVFSRMDNMKDHVRRIHRGKGIRQVR